MFYKNLWNEIMRFTRDQRHFENEFALLLETCDKKCFHIRGGEKGTCVSLRSNNATSLAKCRWSPVKSTISWHPPRCDSNFCHTSAGIMPSRLQMFTGPQRKRYFFEVQGYLNSFCHTSAGIMPSSLHMFTGPQREAYFFAPEFTPERGILTFATRPQ